MKECDHTVTEIRWRNRDINMVGRQCLRCGKAIGQWIKHADLPADKSGIPFWDEELHHKWWAEWRAQFRPASTSGDLF